MQDFSLRLYTLQKAMGIKKKGDLAQKLGVSRTTIYNYENEDPPPPEDFLTKVQDLEKKHGLYSGHLLNETEGQYIAKPKEKAHTVPVLGWAHAGQAETYEELPMDWQERVPTACPDKSAFGLIVEGDSMTPDINEGDELIVMPSYQAQSGQLVVAKMANDGIILRKIQILQSGSIRMIPSNNNYSPEDIEENDIQWMFPVYGSFRHWHRV